MMELSINFFSMPFRPFTTQKIRKANKFSLAERNPYQKTVPVSPFTG